MTDTPPQAPPAAPPAGLMPFDPDVELDAQLIQRYGSDGRTGFANHVTGTLVAHGRTLDQHGQRLDAVDHWADGVNVFGEQQLALNATMTAAVTHSARRQDHLESHITRTQVIELVAAVVLGVACVMFSLWVGKHKVIGDVVVSHTLAVWVAWAFFVGWGVIVAVMLAGWFRPQREEPAAEANADPAPADAPPPPAA